MFLTGFHFAGNLWIAPTAWDLQKGNQPMKVFGNQSVLLGHRLTNNYTQVVTDPNAYYELSTCTKTNFVKAGCFECVLIIQTNPSSHHNITTNCLEYNGRCTQNNKKENKYGKLWQEDRI